MSAQDGVTGSAARPTMKSVADALGVSIATVSNAFNRPDQLSSELRERVLAEARRRGLSRPDPAARSLRRGRVTALGVVYTDQLSYAFSDPAAVAFLTGVTRECESADCDLVLIPRSSRAESARTAVGRSMVDGVVFYSVADDDPLLLDARRLELPTVIVDQPRTAGRCWIGIDDESAAGRLARHVLELGHRQLAIVTTEIDRRRLGGDVGAERQPRIRFATTAARLRGYRRAIADAGLDWAGVRVHEATANDRAAGAVAGAELLTAPNRPTAVLAMTDLLATGVVDAAAQLGLGVPDDVSVTGFDGIPAQLLGGGPPLTTVAQPHEEKGARAARLLLDGARPGETMLAHRLVAGTSTAPPSP